MSIWVTDTGNGSSSCILLKAIRNRWVYFIWRTTFSTGKNAASALMWYLTQLRCVVRSGWDSFGWFNLDRGVAITLGTNIMNFQSSIANGEAHLMKGK